MQSMTSVQTVTERSFKTFMFIDTRQWCQYIPCDYFIILKHGCFACEVHVLINTQAYSKVVLTLQKIHQELCSYIVNSYFAFQRPSICTSG